MKVLKIFKKPVFLITLVVLAAILSVSMIAVGAENAELGGSVSKYQVGMQGSVMFKLTLDNPGAGMEDTGYYRATVGDRNCGTYPVSQVKTDGYIVVRLKPTEMSKTVTVTAVSGNEEREIWTGSVRGYAETVLGRSDLSASHNVMRAMLNWGAKTETKFATSGTTADGIFARDTDPMNAVTTDTINATTRTSTFAGAFVKEDSTTEIILGEGNVSLRFKIKANKDLGKLTATVSRDGWTESKATQVTYEGGYYIVNIDSISTLWFDKVYSVSIDDENGNSVTAYASVLENLDKIIEGKGSDTSEGVKNVAKTLYQFYLLSANKTDLDCQHNVSGYWIPTSEAGKDRYMCSACFEQLMNENVELYMSPYDLKDKAKFNLGTADAGICNDGAFPYIRYSNPTLTTGNYFQYRFLPDGNEAVTGRYLVLKYRYQRETSAQYLTMYAHTKGNEKTWADGALRHQMVSYTAEKGAKWHVLVIDLALYKGTEANVAFTDTEGKYIADVVQLRLFGNDWSGGCSNLAATDFIDFAYIAMVDELDDLKEFVVEDTYNYGMSMNGFHIRNTDDHTCVSDRWGGATNKWTINETTHASTGCVNCGIEAIPEEPHTYGNVGGAYKCTVCGYEPACKGVHVYEYVTTATTHNGTCKDCGATVSGNHTFKDAVCTVCGHTNVELYLSAEELSKKYSTNTNFSADYVTNKGETPYFHIERLTKTSRPEISLIASSNTKETGQYLIIKYRAKNSVTDDPNGIVLYANTTETTDNRNYNAALTYDEDWHVLVCDLSKVNPNHSDPTKVPYDKYVANKDGMYVATKLNIRVLGGGWSGDGTWDGTLNKSVLNGQKEGDYIDIAYIAMVNSLDDIRDFVTEETIDWRTGSKTNESRDTATLTETVAE